jgi:glycosyltransferase involved in cell wall biosynthesis
MKTVVLVAPWFVPNNLASVHRARLWANHLPEFGWKPVILTVRPEFYEEKPEPELERLLPKALQIVRSRAFPITKPRLVGDIGWRSTLFMRGEFKRLRKAQRIDFVHFTVPAFPPALLGPWLDQTGTPYGLDYIDPWVPERPFRHFPGSKAWWAQKSGVWLEPVAVKRARLITGITEGYYRGVLNRNPHLKTQAVTRAMPYGFDVRDHEEARNGMAGFRPVFPKDGKINLIYAGALLPRAHDNLRLFLQALLRLEKDPAWKGKVRVTFIGTGPDPKRPDLYTIRWIAEEMGAGGLVQEVPGRLPYLDVIRNLEAADGIVVLGSDESHYSPSKIYQSMLSGKPIFGLMHPESLATRTIREMGAGLVATNPDTPPLTAERLAEKLKEYLSRLLPEFQPADLGKLDKWSARSSARSLAEGLEEAVRR